jgi:hypothetical protein
MQSGSTYNVSKCIPKTNEVLFLINIKSYLNICVLCFLSFRQNSCFQVPVIIGICLKASFTVFFHFSSELTFLDYKDLVFHKTYCSATACRGEIGGICLRNVAINSVVPT